MPRHIAADCGRRNNEFYELSRETVRAGLRRTARGTNVLFLDNDVADLSIFEHWAASRREALSRVRLLGTNLWTDYRYNAGKTQRQLMEHAELRISDHRVIQTADGRFTASQALSDHELSRAWLERELARPFDGKTVVLTHHAPHPLSRSRNAVSTP